FGRDTFGDADDDADTGSRGFHDGIGCERRRHENNRYIGAGFFNGICNRVEYRAFEMRSAAFARSNTAHHIRAVFNHLRSVVSALIARETLYDYFGILIY